MGVTLPAGGDDLLRYREEFPVVERHCYLDHATMAPLPRRVADAVTRHLAERAERGSLSLPRWVAMVEAARARAAAFIGARPEEVAFVKNTTEGVLLAAESVDWRPGDNVVTVQGEFPANVYPWLMLSARGVEVRAVPQAPGNRVPVEDLLARVDGRTRVLVLSHVQFSTGFAADLETLGRACEAAGVILFVDAAQSLGALRLDVRKLGISMLSANSGKWLLGPGGVGIFYCAADVLDRLVPTNVGWRSVRNPGDARNIRLDLRPEAARFEEGSWNLPGIAGLNAALEFLMEVGMERVEARIMHLTTWLAERLQRLGHHVLSPRGPGEGSGILAFRVPGHHAKEVVADLREEGVVVSLCGDAIRVSPHFYNVEEEMERLLARLPRPAR